MEHLSVDHVAVNNNLSEELLRLQGALKLNLSDFAERLGVDYHTVERIYDGRTKRISKKIIAAAQYLKNELSLGTSSIPIKPLMTKREEMLLEDFRRLTMLQQNNHLKNLRNFLLDDTNSSVNKNS